MSSDQSRLFGPEDYQDVIDALYDIKSRHPSLSRSMGVAVLASHVAQDFAEDFPGFDRQAFMNAVSRGTRYAPAVNPDELDAAMAADKSRYLPGGVPKREPAAPEGAPAWNCVSYPGDGMHYTPGPDGRCVWCGMTRDQIAAEHRKRDEGEQYDTRFGVLHDKRYGKVPRTI
jgi:hypothetical protein